jgi:two-component system, NarL family, sensor histidine kinase NreB
VGVEGGEVRIKLSDDGKGFDPAARHDGFGLRGMSERVEAMGGHLSIESAKCKGTIITIILPFPSNQQVVAP